MCKSKVKEDKYVEVEAITNTRETEGEVEVGVKVEEECRRTSTTVVEESGGGDGNDEGNPRTPPFGVERYIEYADVLLDAWRFRAIEAGPPGQADYVDRNGLPRTYRVGALASRWEHRTTCVMTFPLRGESDLEWVRMQLEATCRDAFLSLGRAIHAGRLSFAEIEEVNVPLGLDDLWLAYYYGNRA